MREVNILDGGIYGLWAMIVILILAWLGLISKPWRCKHEHMSRIWVRYHPEDGSRDYYQVCLDCGMTRPYRKAQEVFH